MRTNVFLFAMLFLFWGCNSQEKNRVNVPVLGENKYEPLFGGTGNSPFNKEELRVTWQELNDRFETLYNIGDRYESSNTPDFYGGHYMSLYGDFVVMVKGDTSGYEQKFRKELKTNRVLVRPCQYNFRQLNEEYVELREKLRQKSEERTLNTFNFGMAGIEEHRNRIVIELSVFTPETVEFFKKNLMDSPMFEFEKGAV